MELAIHLGGTQIITRYAEILQKEHSNSTKKGAIEAKRLLTTARNGINPLFCHHFLDFRQGISQKNAISAISANRASHFSKSSYLWVVQVN